MRSASECLDDELIMELVQGRLPDDDLLAAEEHMTGCPDCRMVVAEAAAVDASSESTAPTRPVGLPIDDIDPAGRTLAPGERVNRYQIQELIGVGAIGAVYAAHDPHLHRRVALKVLRAGGAMGSPAGDLQARLLREARAMAQLSHPNVVTVHDAGTYADGVFLAMELVDGTTLARWLKGDERGLDEIVSMFRAAGEGLAAAHRSGLVHRDFKPDNVLVGDDGRVRVTDFGLARPTSWEKTGPHRAIGGGDAWVRTVVTRTGVVAGTPAYMAPEQFTGKPPDPRSDQFSFCVALYEAIYRERPFAGPTLDDLVDAIIHGRVSAPPAGVSVPGALRAAVLRGLSVKREDRHPSMDALLGQLAAAVPVGLDARRPGRRRPAVVIGAVGALAVGAVALTAALVAAGGESESRPARTARPALASPAPEPDPTPIASAPAPEPAEPLVDARPPEPSPAATEEPEAEEPHKASARRPRPQRAPRREEEPARERKPAPARVGDGLRDPFGGGGDR
ncbi:MAG TPA: protein kinase [Kofleriaceae bacterium]